MFTEEEALQQRLIQLNETEINVIKEYQTERDKIYKRLKEIQIRKSGLPNLSKLAAKEREELEYQYKRNKGLNPTMTTKSNEKKERRGARPSDKTKILREAALKVLKRHKASIKSSQLKEEIEKESGIKVINMTLFMTSLMNSYPEVKKPYRGQYYLEDLN